ncbi:hypothetical protein J6Q66_08820 [bacterium]|nr:hypothetical protein [bacterium]
MTETKKKVKEEDVKAILPVGEEEFKAEEIKAEDIIVAPLEEDGAVLEIVSANEDIITAKLPDGEVIEIDKDSIVKPECNDADHISRAKVLDVIQTTMNKYEGKVVLAMEEVRAIIKAITNAVKE